VQLKQLTAAPQDKSVNTQPLTTITNKQGKAIMDLSLKHLRSVFKSKEIKSSSILITIREAEEMAHN
jgi:hypothetical protein